MLFAGFQALDLEQQDELFTLLQGARLERMAGEENEIGQYLRSLRRAQEYGGGEELSPGRYRTAWLGLRERGEEIHELGQVRRFFGTWRAAKEALGLAEVTTPMKIEARFRGRLVGKVHHYTEQSLRETMERCHADLGKVPLQIEFQLWRQRELELAKARGEDLFLPSDSPYRRRWGSWEKALQHLGYLTEEVECRLDPSRPLRRGAN